VDKIAQGNQAAALEQRAGQHSIAIMDHGICAAGDPQKYLCKLCVGDPAAMQGQCQQCSVKVAEKLSMQIGRGSS
jgi:hypothetical protein